MKTAAKLLSEHITRLEKTLIAFKASDKNSIKILCEAKQKLSEKCILDCTESELYNPAVYNALAVINSAPLQSEPNSQLTFAVIDAKEELKAILEILQKIKKCD